MRAANLACNMPQLTLGLIVATLSALLGAGVVKTADEIPTAKQTLEEGDRYRDDQG
jgi:hypothetical protein